MGVTKLDQTENVVSVCDLLHDASCIKVFEGSMYNVFDHYGLSTTTSSHALGSIFSAH